jgi:hypothetical protein
MRRDDQLIIEVATTENLSEEAAQKAAQEYAKTRSFTEFVTSALLQNTDLHIDLNSVFFEGSIEGDKAILIKILYRNLTGNKIFVTLPDRSIMDFEDKDTIRLLLTRKYSSHSIKKSISDSNLFLVDSLNTPWEPRYKNGFGMDLILLAPQSSPTPVKDNNIWTPKN